MKSMLTVEVSDSDTEKSTPALKTSMLIPALTVVVYPTVCEDETPGVTGPVEGPSRELIFAC
jgi:hypothetical protein